jgi:hypothetical protein
VLGIDHRDSRRESSKDARRRKVRVHQVDITEQAAQAGRSGQIETRATTDAVHRYPQPGEVGDQLILPREHIGDPVGERLSIPVTGCFGHEALGAADPESLDEDENPVPVNSP